MKTSRKCQRLGFWGRVLFAYRWQWPFVFRQARSFLGDRTAHISFSVLAFVICLPVMVWWLVVKPFYLAIKPNADAAFEFSLNIEEGKYDED